MVRRKKSDQTKEQTTQTETHKPNFEVREDDRLVINFDGATIPIGPYATVKLDGLMYTRTLREGDDPAEEFDKIYRFLESEVYKRSRKKLATFRSQMKGSQDDG